MKQNEKEAMRYVLSIVDSSHIGSKMPSEGQLSIKFNINRMSARNILHHLEILGSIKSIPKKGYFVVDNLVHSRIFSKFSKTQVSEIKQMEIPSFVFKIINQHYPLIDWFNQKNKELKGYLKEYKNSANELVNSTFLVTRNKVTMKDFISKIEKSIIKTLLKEFNADITFNTILGSDSKIFKITIFANELGSIVAVSLTEVFPEYLYERFIKKIY